MFDEATRAGFADELEKIGFSWKKFREGLKDEGIPLSGATAGAALGALAKHKGLPIGGLTGAALGYALGSGASLARSKVMGKRISPEQKLLALSGLGYGLGGLTHGGIKLLTRKMKPSTMKSLFHGVKGMKPGSKPGKVKFLEALTEEGLPALGATLGAGYAMGSSKGKH